MERWDERLCRFCRSAVEDEGHALLVCEGDAELVRLRQELVDNLALKGLLRRCSQLGVVGTILHLSHHKLDDVVSSWARYVYRVLAVFERTAIWVPPGYRVP